MGIASDHAPAMTALLLFGPLRGANELRIALGLLGGIGCRS